MSPSRREMEGILGAFAFEKAQRAFLRKSPEGAERAGARWGRLLFRVSKKHRERALTNLTLAFPEMSPTERLALAQRVFEHYGIATADFLRASRRSIEELDATTEVRGRENLDDGLSRGKGVLLITGHFGNWERCSSWMSAHGYPLNVIIRDANNSKLNDMVNELRTSTGTRVIPRGNAARPMIERLRANEIIGILPDQNTDEAYLPFFGHPAGTTLGPGVIASRTGAAVVPMWTVRIGPNRYQINFEPVMEPLPGYEVNGEGMMRAVMAFLERVIRLHPEQWLWFHDRWKSARRKGLL